MVCPNECKRARVRQMGAALGVPFRALLAAGKDIYRKPNTGTRPPHTHAHTQCAHTTGMWDHLCAALKKAGKTVNMQRSFFVGPLVPQCAEHAQ